MNARLIQDPLSRRRASWSAVASGARHRFGLPRSGSVGSSFRSAGRESAVAAPLCRRSPKARQLFTQGAPAFGHGGAVPAISRRLSASDTPGLAAKRPAPRRGARLFAQDGRGLAPLRGAMPLGRATGGVVAALRNPRLMAGSLSGCSAAGNAPCLPTACDDCEPSPFAERGEKVAGGRMRGFLPVGDDVRSLTSNADCQVWAAELSESLLTSAPTSEVNPSPQPSPVAPQREREKTSGSAGAENCGTVSCAGTLPGSARGRAGQQPGRLRSPFLRSAPQLWPCAAADKT